MENIADAYESPTNQAEHILGTTVSPEDPDRSIIEPWAAQVNGSILDVGAGTGRWTGHLAMLGYDATGLEPAQRLVTIARETYPAVKFWHGSIADLDQMQRRWAGILAWYSVIHMSPDQLQAALTTLRKALADDGTLLLSFFTGPTLESFQHPVATGYRWPVQDMTRALEKVGFDVLEQHRNSHTPHAYVIGQPKLAAQSSRSTSGVS